jgi:hypothetical protein
VGTASRGDYLNGFQLVPVNWSITTQRKQQFFELTARISGAAVTSG